MARPRKYTHDKRCLECGSNWVVKDGHANTKQQYKCKDCGRRFTEGATVTKYPQSVRNEVISMYCEGMSFGAIARVKDIKKNTIFQWIKKKENKPTNLEKNE
jgi:transposase-like protein